MRLTLNKKYELAKTYYGFKKGIAWWWWLRIAFVIGSSGAILYPMQILSYTTMSEISLSLWLLYLAVWGFWGYGIYSSSDLGYYFILISQISQTPIVILLTESTIYNATSSFHINSTLIGGWIGQFITCCINLYYFHNRKIIFKIFNEDGDNVDDIPKMDTVNNGSSLNYEPPVEYPEHKKYINSLSAIFMIISVIVSVLLVISCVYSYTKYKENKYLSERVAYLQEDSLYRSNNDDKYQDLMSYLKNYDSKNSGMNFSVTKDVLYLKCGETYTGIFTYWGDIPFTAHLDNGNLSFDWNNNKNDIGAYYFTIKALHSGCTTLTISQDDEPNATTTMLIIIE